MSKISPHFSTEEWTRSDTARRYNIDNSIPESLMPFVRATTMMVLEPLREYAQEPVRISSGYRCKALNDRVGGSKNSQHMSGMAVDIVHPDKRTLMRWFVWLMDRAPNGFDQLIWEKGGQWIHVSYRPDGRNRQQVILQ